MKKKCIIVDLEGTLSDHSHRLHHLQRKYYDGYNAEFKNDPVNEEFVTEFIIDRPASVDIILCTAKSIQYERDVRNWIKNHDLFQYIDDFYYRDETDDSSSMAVKFNQLKRIQKKYDIICAYDDRPDNIDMYRRNGVKAFLVGEKSPPSPLFTPDLILKECAETFKMKNEEYGNGYKSFGGIMTAFFPNGIILVTEKDFTRFAILNIMLAKVDRYCKNFKTGGHKDSLNDLAVYSAMLNEVDNGL